MTDQSNAPQNNSELESRLRTSLTIQAATVPAPTPRWDDLAPRLASSTRHRRLAGVTGALAALALALGGGVALGSTATTASAPTTTLPSAHQGAAALAPGTAAQAPTTGPALCPQTTALTHTFTRTTATGVAIRAYTSSACSPEASLPPNAPTSAQTTSPTGSTTCITSASSLLVELSTPSAVTTGQLYIPAPQTPYHPIINNPTTSPVTTTPATTTPPTDPNAPTPNPGGTQTGVFGTQEGQPVGWIAIHTSDPSVATVTSAFSAAPSDQMAPIDGYAVLAAPLNAAATDFTAVLTFSDANGNIITTQSVDSAAPLPIAIPHTGSAASSGTSSSGGSPTPLVPTTTPGSQAIIACPPTTAPAVATPAPQTKP